MLFRALSCAIKKIGDYDIIISGRQAIDGDTAQVGPQVAEKLGIPQITYAEEIVELKDKSITIKRRIEKGVEIVKSELPVLLTANATAKEGRPRNAKLLQKFKHARTVSEQVDLYEDDTNIYSNRTGLNINEWSTKDVDAHLEEYVRSDSPKKITTSE